MSALALGLSQAFRIPYAGWVVVVLLSPAILGLAALALLLLVRFLFVEHLASAAVVLDESRGFHAFCRLFAWFRAAPARVSRLHGRALVLGLYRGTRRALPGAVLLALLWWLLPDRVIEAVAGALRGPLVDPGAERLAVLLAVALPAAWVVAPLVSAVYGAHAALYLAHRLAIDGVPIDAPPIVPEGDRTLEDLGIELVQRLRDEPEEG
jgi:hypothetical protein